MYLGSWKIDDYLTFCCNTHDPDTGVATDADSVPSYRVYEDETGTAILTGSMALLDSSNTTGFYSEQIQLTAANGFEKGKCYTIYISATVDSDTGTMHHTFQIEAEVDANTVSGTVTPADGSITAAKIATGAIDADAIADNAIDAGAIASDAITAAKIATDAITSDELATSALNEIADAILTRDWTSVSGEAARSVLNALRALRNKVSISGTTLTVTEEDDSTQAWAATVTVDSGANPITAVDPD